MSLRDVERVLESEQMMAHVSDSHGGSTVMHHPDCGKVTSDFQRAPASMLRGRGFRWAECCKNRRGGD